MKRLGPILFSLLLFSHIYGQKRDPRSVGLVGATTTIAEGIYAVGYNPALIAYQVDKPFMMQLGGIDFGMANNYLSMAAMQSLSGTFLDEDEKTLIINRLERNGGLAFNVNGLFAIPGINYASGNMAFTANFLYMGSYSIPAGLARLMLEGNANNPEIDMTIGYEIMGINEMSFSFAVPYESFALGFSLKYLQGVFYFGIDPDSSNANFVTTPTAVYGSGSYYLRQGIGGAGYALDIGVATKEYNGFRFGVSLINALGTIGWNKPSFLKDILAGKDNEFGNDDDLYHMTWDGQALKDSDAILYTYTIDSIRADNLSGESLFSSSSEIKSNVDENGKPKEFNIRYPSILRFGVSYKKNDLLITSDLTTGFENRLYAHSRWRWAIGTEILRFPNWPFRIGFAWEGMDRTELGMGLGFHGGPTLIDFGFSFRNGMWVHSMKGLNVSLGFTVTSFKGKKKKGDAENVGPSPVPEGTKPPDTEKSLPGEDQK
tara:strand:- start:598 stop:2058 length:1461 start_codon:yes stop_codon:yes gene_type:complete